MDNSWDMLYFQGFGGVKKSTLKWDKINHFNVDNVDIEIEDEPIEERPLSEYSAKELREIGKDYGLTFKVGISKAEMIAAIEAAEADLDTDCEDDEDVPAFDASEAVQ